MLHSGLAAGMISLSVVFWSNGAFALERAALALSGSDCRLSHQDIIKNLERLDGVTRVEAETIPDHLLVDHDGLRRTGEELAGFVNGLAALQGRCRAAVMQSCITAETGPGGTRPAPGR
jgi:copper chaperone CopZ